MGDAAMELGDRELHKIGEYVKSHLAEWSEGKVVDFRTNRELDLLERMIRVEESLKTQMELTRQGFESMDKRFESVDKRFESVDKRFESMDKRFEDMQNYMDKRFAGQQWVMGLGFTLLAGLMSIFNFF